MMYLGLSIDPGMENGLCIFTWGDEEPFAVEAQVQYQGGAPGLHRLLEGGRLRYQGGWDTSVGKESHTLMFGDRPLHALVVEKFTPRPITEDSGFHLTRKSAEPLRCEGVLLGMGLDDYGAIQWAEPSQQYFIGDPSAKLPVKKQRSRQFLKDHGFLATGTSVVSKDGNDANSATLHAIAWLRRRRHMPTINALFGALTEG